MPLYEYECDACGNRFEQIQKFSDPPADVCPKCGERKVRKLMSSPAIKFKGSGFYINDYAPKGTGTDTKDSAAKGTASQDAASKESASSDSSKASSSSGSADKAPATTSKSSSE